MFRTVARYASKLEKAKSHFFFSRDIAAALDELDPRTNDTKCLKQRYWIIQFASASYRSEIPYLLSQISNDNENPTKLSWKQMLHEYYIITAELDEAEKVRNSFKNENLEESELR